MILTPEQEQAIAAIDAWLKDDDQWMFYLGGYAGTGKTTLMHHFINSLQREPTCLAPTGKAASVLQKRLHNATVSTIHSALYKPITPNIDALLKLEIQLEIKKKLGEAVDKVLEDIREEKRRLMEQDIKFGDNENKAILPGSLVIVDEASMVTNRMFDDLSKLNAKVLFVGDPGQLPPVKDSGYFTYTRPDAMLRSVQRQALDNPIIELSMKVRNGDSIPARIDNDHIIRTSKVDFDLTQLGYADQVL